MFSTDIEGFKFNNSFRTAISKDNPDKLEAAYARFIPIMVKAIQELSAKVAVLEAA